MSTIVSIMLDFTKNRWRIWFFGLLLGVLLVSCVERGDSGAIERVSMETRQHRALMDSLFPPEGYTVWRTRVDMPESVIKVRKSDDSTNWPFTMDSVYIGCYEMVGYIWTPDGGVVA